MPAVPCCACCLATADSEDSHSGHLLCLQPRPSGQVVLELVLIVVSEDRRCCGWGGSPQLWAHRGNVDDGHVVSVLARQ